MESLTDGRTIIVIAHRLSPIERADRVAVLDRGQAVEREMLAELPSRDGLYAKLPRIQFATATAVV